MVQVGCCQGLNFCRERRDGGGLNLMYIDIEVPSNPFASASEGYGWVLAVGQLGVIPFSFASAVRVKVLINA
jgi:hypothetical protein